jgi:hypothetical protein
MKLHHVMAALAVMLAAGCGDNAAPEDASDVVKSWKAAGLEVGEMTALDEHELGEASCERGEVKGVETTLCAYDSDEAAEAARPAGLAAVGDATGSALANGKVLLIVADRDKADPDGKTINQMTKVFMGK